MTETYVAPSLAANRIQSLPLTTTTSGWAITPWRPSSPFAINLQKRFHVQKRKMMKSIVLILLAQSDYLWLFDIVNLVKEENP